MSSSRRLVQRQQRADATPRRSRQEASHTTTPLPPYEPPKYPLSTKYQVQLAEISTNHDFGKYKKHIQASIQSLTNSTGDLYEQLYSAKENLGKLVAKRQKAEAEGGGDIEKTDLEENATTRADELEKKVNKLAKDAEKSLRDLIDYGDAMAQQSNIIKTLQEEVAINAAAAPDINPVQQPRKRARLDESDEEDDQEPEVEPPQEAPFDVLSPTELLQKQKAEYEAEYSQKSLRRKYANNNDYIGFKRSIHDAQYGGQQDAPPVPNASEWFPSERRAEKATKSAAGRRIRTATAGEDAVNVEEVEDDDDDIQIAGEKASLKCPLTLQEFREPYSNHKCRHTFEKTAIIDFWKTNAQAEMAPSQGRRRAQPIGLKFIQCPETGCSAKLELEDFYDDQIMIRKVRRAIAARGTEHEDSMMQDRRGSSGDESDISVDGGFDEDE